MPITASASWRLSPGVRWLDSTSLAGGAPYRVITLTERGADERRSVLDPADPGALESQRSRPVGAVTQLLERLENAGLVLAPTPPPSDHGDVTLVVPARSAVEPVRRLIELLPTDLPIVLVDDGSPSPLSLLAQESANVTVIRHEVSQGPGAARNAGAATVTTRWTAFLDADTEPDPRWISMLKGHVEQVDRAAGESGLRVVMAAPRIHPLPGTGRGGWFENRVCALDLGGIPSDVGIGRTVSYVPSAALLVSTEAFREVGGFDESMLVGEDVDLVWRMATLGRIRYVPDVLVGHQPRGTLAASLRRRADYGTSAADLGRRHPGALRHVDVSVWSFAPWALAVVVHPAVGAAAALVSTAIAPWGMRSLSARHARTLAAQGHLRAGGALGRWLIRPMLPVTVAAALLSPKIGRRLMVSAATGLGYLVVLDVRSARLSVDRWTHVARLSAESLLARTLDDIAYSAGVWQGVFARRTLEPVLPRVRDLPSLRDVPILRDLARFGRRERPGSTPR